MVEKFNMKFFTDDEECEMFYDGNDDLNYYDVAMKRYGYMDENNNILIKKFKKEDLIPYKN